MARYKHYDYAQMKMLPISFDRQILPGTFEHTLSYLIDEKVDLSVFEARYRNDEGGAPAYDPAILLKIVLYAYSKGIIYSRRIEQLCRENVVCMALSADTVPHFTTIAAFVSSLSAEITTIFRNVLLVYDEVGADRPGDVRDRWGEAAEQCLEGMERHEVGPEEEGAEDAARGGASAVQASSERCSRSGCSRAGGGGASDQDLERCDREGRAVSGHARGQSRQVRQAQAEQPHR